MIWFSYTREVKEGVLIVVLADEQKLEADDPGYLSFETFDITKVLENGTPLEASGGQVCICVYTCYVMAYSAALMLITVLTAIQGV